VIGGRKASFLPETDVVTATDSTEHPYWRRNMIVTLVGSFTTIVAMTLLLPFLPPGCNAVSL
jgi:hypothetical protein